VVKINTFPHLPQKYYHNNIFYTDKKAVSITVEKELSNKLSGHCFQKGKRSLGSTSAMRTDESNEILLRSEKMPSKKKMMINPP